MIRLHLHDNQLNLLEQRKRFNVFACGRRFGKSQTAFALQTELARLPYVTYCGYANPTAEDYAKRWNECTDTLSQIITDVRIQEGIIQLMGKVNVHWFGLHRDTGIRGNKYHRFIVDEAAHAPKLRDTWQYVIRPTLADYKGDAYFLSTPLSGSYFNELMRTRRNDDEWSVRTFTTYDNPYIDHSEIGAAKKELPSIVFRQEYMAEDVLIEGSRIKREWLRYGDVPEGCEYALGVDLAITKTSEADYTALVVSAKKDSTYYIADVVQGRMSFREAYAAIVQLATKYNVSAVAVEAVAYQAAMIQELIANTTLPIQSIHPHKDKITRFFPIEGKYEHGHIIHAKGLPSDFEYQLLEFPNSEHDDMVDALQMSITAHGSGVKLIML